MFSERLERAPARAKDHRSTASHECSAPANRDVWLESVALTTVRPGPQIIVISGLPGAGKSTVARLVASRLGRAAHVEADRLQDLIVAGAVSPDLTGTGAEAARQLQLRLHNAALLARSFLDSGFSAIIDDIVAGPRFGQLARDLKDVPFSFVMLLADLDVMKSKWRAMGSPFAESWDWIDEDIRKCTPRVGLWIETTSLTAEETANEVLERLGEAEVPWPSV